MRKGGSVAPRIVGRAVARIALIRKPRRPVLAQSSRIAGATACGGAEQAEDPSENTISREGALVPPAPTARTRTK